MTNGSNPLPCWIRKETVALVALIPATVPLLRIIPLVMAPVPFPIKSKPGAKLAAPVPPLFTASCPVKEGTKVRVFAVVVLTLIRMLVSLVVATWIAGPVRAEIDVRALVR